MTTRCGPQRGRVLGREEGELKSRRREAKTASVMGGGT